MKCIKREGGVGLPPRNFTLKVCGAFMHGGAIHEGIARQGLYAREQPIKGLQTI